MKRWHYMVFLELWRYGSGVKWVTNLQYKLYVCKFHYPCGEVSVFTCWWLHRKCVNCAFLPPSIRHSSVVNYDAVTPVTCMSPKIWHIIHRDVSEISIVSSWALTDVFHCEYQPRRWWISPFSSNLVTNSHRLPWCQSQSVSSRCHMSLSAAEYTAAGLKGSQ